MTIKKLISVVVLALTSWSVAFAADKAGDPCTQSGYSIQGVAPAVVLSCVNDQWKGIGVEGTTPVRLSVKLFEGSEIITQVDAYTIEGRPTPITVVNEYTYVSKATRDGDKVLFTPGTVRDGFTMSFVPTLTAKGGVEVEFVASQTKLTAINKVTQDGLEIERPQLNSIDLKQKIAIDNGGKVLIPFGPVVKPGNGEKVQNQYTLELAAARS